MGVRKREFRIDQLFFPESQAVRSIRRRGLLAMALFSTLFGWPGPAKASKGRFADIGEFRNLVIAAFKRQPGVDSVAPDASDPAKLTFMMGKESWTVDVTNSYGYLIAYPDENVDSAIDRLVRATMDVKRKVVSENNIVAVIRSREYIDYVKEKGIDVLVEPLGADLMITYMADRPDSMVPITRKEARDQDLPDLRRIALNHVRQWLPKVVADDRLQLGVLYYVEGNTMLSTSLILLDEFWKSIETRFPGDVLIALPRRDQLFIFDDGNPTAKALARQLIDRTTKENFNLLSQKLYARRSGQFVFVTD
jgi:uncharacterized protein YtpQ (UPF0354 family)